MIQDPHADSTTDGLLVFADDWGRHPSSCQHLMRRLRERHKILWANTIGTRTPTLDGFTLFRGGEKLKNWARGLKRDHPNMWILDVPMLPSIRPRICRQLSRQVSTNYLRICLRRIGVQRPTVITTLPHVSWLLGNVHQKQLIYYCTDDYSTWRGADQATLLSSEDDLVRKADRVLAVSNRLLDRFPHHEHKSLFPHAVDYEHFASVSEGIVSHADLGKYPSRRVGFFGLIYEKLDFTLLSKVANAIAPQSLIMIGPVDYCPSDFRNLPNVHFVGKQPYFDLPRWIAGLDVLLLPYLKDDPMIHQSSPLKLRECLATGKPTVSVDVPEVRKYEPHVSVNNTDEEFVKSVLSYLAAPADVTEIIQRQQSVRQDTWDARAHELEAYLSTTNGAQQ